MNIARRRRYLVLAYFLHALRFARFVAFYSGLNLNQDKAASRRQYTRYGKASQRCTGLNLIHYILALYK